MASDTVDHILAHQAFLETVDVPSHLPKTNSATTVTMFNQRRAGENVPESTGGAIVGGMSTINRVYAGRLAGMFVRNSDGDAIGRVRDVVVRLREHGKTSAALGLVVEDGQAPSVYSDGTPGGGTE